MLLRARTLSHAAAWAEALRDNPELQREMLQRIKRRLFDEGTNEDDKIIGRYKAFTQKLNPEKVAGSPYTLYDTGEFYASLYVGFMSDYFFIDGDGDKGRENLFDKFGMGIIGLTDDQREWLGGEVIEKYKEYVRRVLFGA